MTRHHGPSSWPVTICLPRATTPRSVARTVHRHPGRRYSKDHPPTHHLGLRRHDADGADASWVHLHQSRRRRNRPLPTRSIPVHSIPVHAIPVHSIPVHAIRAQPLSEAQSRRRCHRRRPRDPRRFRRKMRLAGHRSRPPHRPCACAYDDASFRFRKQRHRRRCLSRLSGQRPHPSERRAVHRAVAPQRRRSFHPTSRDTDPASRVSNSAPTQASRAHFAGSCRASGPAPSPCPALGTHSGPSIPRQAPRSRGRTRPPAPQGAQARVERGSLSR